MNQYGPVSELVIFIANISVIGISVILHIGAPLVYSAVFIYCVNKANMLSTIKQFSRFCITYVFAVQFVVARLWFPLLFTTIVKENEIDQVRSMQLYAAYSYVSVISAHKAITSNVSMDDLCSMNGMFK